MPDSHNFNIGSSTTADYPNACHPNSCADKTITDKHHVTVGDIVIADYQHARVPLRGTVKAIHDNGYADIFIGKHGYSKITVAIDRLYPDRAQYNAAMQAKTDAEFAKTYERISTVDGLLMFLSGNEMLCKGDASDDQWRAVMKRLDEARVASLKGCVFD